MLAIMVLECTSTSLSERWKTLVAGDGYAGLSKMALHYIGGLIKHAPALLAFNPRPNSQAACSWFEAPVNLATRKKPLCFYRIPLSSNRRLSAWSSAVRINGESYPFAAMLCAGIDGINEIDPGEPLDVDIYELSPEELAKIPSTPGSLDAKH